MGIFYEQVKERMIRYAKINTQSAGFTGTWPTTSCQMDLARELYRELKEIGAADVWLDEDNCLVYARIPSNLPDGGKGCADGGKGCADDGKDCADSGKGYDDSKSVGFIAHMDTAPDASGKDVKPRVLEGYDGSDIVLNAEKGIIMRAEDYPNLRQYIGQDLILTDGTTLLGGDDKASIAAIMTMAEYYCSNPSIPHGLICLAFTPDEEVGGLAHTLDLERFGTRNGYTLDGDHLGWYEDETFNASQALISIDGRSVHTGTAKGIMVNAVDIASDFLRMLPPREKPQYTEGKEGFYHVISCNASCEHAEISLIIRDFDADRFKKREDYLQECADLLNARYGTHVSLRIIEQYRNMKEVIETAPHLVENLKKAISDCGLTPVCEPFRGGTDGAALSFRGLPCPNLSAGYENAHGRFEYVPVQSMEKNVEILLRLCQLFAGI